MNTLNSVSKNSGAKHCGYVASYSLTGKETHLPKLDTTVEAIQPT